MPAIGRDTTDRMARNWARWYRVSKRPYRDQLPKTAFIFIPCKSTATRFEPAGFTTYEVIAEQPISAAAPRIGIFTCLFIGLASGYAIATTIIGW